MAAEPGRTPATSNRTHTAVRRTDETKPAYKTTEFMAFIAILLGIFIAGALIKGSEDGTDEFMSPEVWLFATILTFGYMLSRGIAKSGSRHRYTDDDNDRH
jgi:hypothetical protein